MDKTEKITFRVSERLKAQILLQAINRNMNVAEYIRYLVQKDLENSSGKKPELN